MGNRGRLLRATPLPADPLPDESAAPPAPIPVGPVPGSPPQPMPVGSDAPPAPIPVEPAPIPAEPSSGSPQPPQPAAAGPSAGKMAAPILLTEQQKQQRGVVVDDRGWREGRHAVGAREEMDERAEAGSAMVFWQGFLHQHRSWAVSAFVHTVIVVILGLLTLSLPDGHIELVSLAEVPEDDLLQVEALPTRGPDVENLSNDVVDRPEVESLQPMIDMQNAAEGVDAASLEVDEVGLEHVPLNDMFCPVGRGTGQANAQGTGKGKRGSGYGLDGAGGGLGGRGGRRGNATGRGATPESEAAVDLALKWLADHQLPDGSWCYNHQLAQSCQGKCPNPGDMPEARIAATAMGILPFLGAGQTHQVGKYQRTVGMGLNYLIARMQIGPQGGSLMEPGGRMYSHGLATIALCEAYAMQGAQGKTPRPSYDGTGEASPGDNPKAAKQQGVPVPGLGQAAQAALNFIAYAQDPVGGGWRYVPRTPGDTSVVGWQLMALLSGKMAYLVVNNGCFLGATKFLDYVATDQYGSNYGYTDPQRASQATQAIGLLGRMYMGWTPDHPGIVQGVQTMSVAGPSRQGNMYYNYYATQVLHHYGGEHWKQWNPRMRDWLTGSQSKNGHTAGSWHFGGGDRGASKGGRLYATSLAAMTLEVYYRHMPLYRKDALEHGNVGQADNGEKKDPFEDDF